MYKNDIACYKTDIYKPLVSCILNATLHPGVNMVVVRRLRQAWERTKVPSAVAAVVVVSLAACSDTKVNTEPLPTAAAVASAVVGDAAAKLDVSGHFTHLSAQEEGELGAGEAVRIANIYAKQFVPLEHTSLGKERGGPIDLRNLVVCGRPLYAASPFEPLPPSVPLRDRRPYGAYWMITLCAKGVPQVSLAVSALATDLKIENGKIRFPFNFGNEFYTQGIPLGHQGEFPSAPEVAVVRTAEFSGRHASSVPELIMPATTEGLPQEARWHIKLDNSTDVATNSGNRLADVLYSGLLVERLGKTTPIQYAAAPEQPTTVQFSYAPPPFYGEAQSAYLARLAASGDITVTAKRRSDRPIKFQVVTRGALK